MVDMLFCLVALVLFTIGFSLVKRGNPFLRGGGDSYTQRRMYRMLGWMMWTTAGVLVGLSLINQLSSDRLSEPTVDQSYSKSAAANIPTVTTSARLFPNLLRDPLLQADAAAGGGVTKTSLDPTSTLTLASIEEHAASSMLPSLVKPLPEDTTAGEKTPEPADVFPPKPDAASAASPAPPEEESPPATEPVNLSAPVDPSKQKELDAELAAANDIVQKNPGSVVGYLQRGNAYGNERKWDLAKLDYQRALQIDNKCTVASFNIAELSFMQGQYDVARPAFLALVNNNDVGDLAKYNVFLCDLFGGHEQTAGKELAVFNEVGSDASYYFANVAWSLYHKKNDEAQNWWDSANQIFAPGKVNLYAKPLVDLGYIKSTS